MDEAAIPGSIEKENDTDNENNADRTNNPIGSCVPIKFGVGVLVGCPKLVIGLPIIVVLQLTILFTFGYWKKILM